MQLEEIKKFLRIYHSQDDEFISECIDFAKAYIKNATNVDYDKNDLLYRDLIRFITAHRYNNRAAVTDKSSVEIPYTIQHLMTYISVRGDYVPEQRAI